MKDIFRFLKMRDQRLEIADVEKKYGINLPPLYKFFITTFEPYFKYEKLKISESEEIIISSIIYPEGNTNNSKLNATDDTLSLESFLDVEETLKFEGKYRGWKNDLIFIGNHSYSGGLMVGIDEEKKDKIYLQTDTLETKFIAINIWEFLSDLEVVFDNYENNTIDESMVYKNFGEDFWRLKPTSL